MASRVLDGLKLGLLEDEGHLAVLDEARETGRFDPLPRSGFTKAYLHRPDELRAEAVSAGCPSRLDVSAICADFPPFNE